MPNDGRGSAEREIDRFHWLGGLSTNDILLSVNINPYKPWPTTTEFVNSDAPE